MFRALFGSTQISAPGIYSQPKAKGANQGKIAKQEALKARHFATQNTVAHLHLEMDALIEKYPQEKELLNQFKNLISLSEQDIAIPVAHLVGLANSIQSLLMTKTSSWNDSINYAVSFANPYAYFQAPYRLPENLTDGEKIFFSTYKDVLAGHSLAQDLLAIYLKVRELPWVFQYPSKNGQIVYDETNEQNCLVQATEDFMTNPTYTVRCSGLVHYEAIKNGLVSTPLQGNDTTTLIGDVHRSYTLEKVRYHYDSSDYLMRYFQLAEDFVQKTYAYNDEEKAAVLQLMHSGSQGFDAYFVNIHKDLYADKNALHFQILDKNITGDFYINESGEIEFIATDKIKKLILDYMSGVRDQSVIHDSLGLMETQTTVVMKIHRDENGKILAVPELKNLKIVCFEKSEVDPFIWTAQHLLTKESVKQTVAIDNSLDDLLKEEDERQVNYLINSLTYTS